MVVDEAVVRLMVVVRIHRHHGERCGSVLRHSGQMKIAHEHEGVVVDGRTPATHVVVYVV